MHGTAGKQKKKDKQKSKEAGKQQSRKNAQNGKSTSTKNNPPQLIEDTIPNLNIN